MQRRAAVAQEREATEEGELQNATEHGVISRTEILEVPWTQQLHHLIALKRQPTTQANKYLLNQLLTVIKQIFISVCSAPQVISDPKHVNTKGKQ